MSDKNDSMPEDTDELAQHIEESAREQLDKQDPDQDQDREQPFSYDITNRFTYHQPSGEGIMRHASLSHGFCHLASMVNEVCPRGREHSLALTKLEEAKFWASAAVARNPETR